MPILLNIMIIIFILVGIVAIIYAYKPILVCKQGEGNIIQLEEMDIEGSLKLLRENGDAEKKAKAFIVLMQLSYVLVHTIINQGNNYDDKKQTKSFCESLTPQVLEELNALEGKYE